MRKNLSGREGGFDAAVGGFVSSVLSRHLLSNTPLLKNLLPKDLSHVLSSTDFIAIELSLEWQSLRYYSSAVQKRWLCQQNQFRNEGIQNAVETILLNRLALA